MENVEKACQVRQDPLFAEQKERCEAFGTLLVRHLLTDDAAFPDFRHPLTGLVFCGRCGGRMGLHADRQEGIFCCRSCGDADSAEENDSISSSLLLKETIGELSRFATAWGEPESLIRLATEAWEERTAWGESPVQQRSRTLLQALSDYLQDKEQEKDALYWKRVRGEIDPVDFLEQRHQLWREKSLAERNLTELEGTQQRLCHRLEERSRELLKSLQEGEDTLSNQLLGRLLYKARGEAAG